MLIAAGSMTYLLIIPKYFPYSASQEQSRGEVCTYTSDRFCTYTGMYFYMFSD